MAFTKSPTQDTYSAERIRLSREIAARDGGAINKDEDLLNVIVEPVKNKATGDNRHFILKRAGTETVYTPPSAGVIRGWFFWEDQYKLYYAVGDTVWSYHVVTGVNTAVASVFGATGTSEIGFCLFQFSTGISKVVATDGTTLITMDVANVIGTAAGVPVHLPYPIYLDGYVFVSKINTADIYNSANDDPLTWPGEFITAEMEGDNLIRLAKVNNYLLAFGTNSIEYFWDAGNATGSPLQRNDTPIKYNTYLAGHAQFGNVIYYVGVNEGGQPDVYMLKDFKIEELGTPTISRYLNSVVEPMTTWKGSIVSCKGHSFYILNVGTAKTYVLDLDTKLWARWEYQTGTGLFDIYNSITISTLTNAYTYFSLGTSSVIYKLNDAVYTDNGVSFTCLITTEQSDFGTLNRKTMRRAAIIGDRPTTNNDILIQWTDDDSQTFNTGLSTNLNQDLACVYRLGSFRQRSFKLTYTANTDFRIQEFEVEINKGRS